MPGFGAPSTPVVPCSIHVLLHPNRLRSLLYDSPSQAPKLRELLPQARQRPHMLDEATAPREGGQGSPGPRGRQPNRYFGSARQEAIAGRRRTEIQRAADDPRRSSPRPEVARRGAGVAPAAFLRGGGAISQFLALMKRRFIALRRDMVREYAASSWSREASGRRTRGLEMAGWGRSSGDILRIFLSSGRRSMRYA